MVATTFSILPAGQVPLAAENFRKQLQFRWNGVDLGGPDATVLDFVGASVSVGTIGTGIEQQFPKQLRIRGNGVDVGGPNIDTLNFSGDAFTVSRGTGDDAGKITITY